MISVDVEQEEQPAEREVENGLPGGVHVRPWRELALLSAIMMELSWATLWYRLFIPASQEVPYPVGLLILTGMLLAVYLPSRMMGYLDTKLSVRRFILFILVMLNLIIGLKTLLYYSLPISLAELLNRPLVTFADMANMIPPEFVTMLMVLLVSWRGVSYADRHVGPVGVLASFRLGILMFFLYGFLLPAIHEQPNLALYIFLFFSLLTLSSARISVLSQMRGGRHIQFNRQWLLGIAGSIAVMVGVSALAISFTNRQLFGYLSLVLTWAIYLLVLILTPVLWLFVRFFFWLFGLIQIEGVINALRNVFIRLGDLLKALGDWLSSITGRFNYEAVELFLRRLTEFKPYYLWIILLIGLGVVLLILGRFVLKEDKVDEQEGEAIASQEDLLSQLRNALRRGFGRLANGIEDILRLNQARRLLAAARVRRIYANLLTLSSRLDHPRHASQTPLEYLPSLEGLFPGLSRELGTITAAYLLVRYGELPETAHDLEEVEGAWKQISAAGQEQLKAKRHGAP